jgi:hypothetical protein
MEVLMTGSNVEKEVAKLDPNGPDYQVFVKALKNFDGLTAERLKMFVERRGLHGPLVYLLPQKDDQGRLPESD